MDTTIWRAMLECHIPHPIPRHLIHMASTRIRCYGTILPICKYHLSIIAALAKEPNRPQPPRYRKRKKLISSWAIGLIVINVDRRCLVITATLYTLERSFLFSHRLSHCSSISERGGFPVSNAMYIIMLSLLFPN